MRPLPWFVAALIVALLLGVSGCSSNSAADLNSAKKDYEAGRYAESEKKLAEILKRDAKNAEALRTMALVLEAQGKNDEAIEAFEDVVKIDPKDDVSFYRMAVIERLVGKTQDAVKHLERAFEVKPDPQYSDDLARTYMQVGRYEDAVKQWEKVLEQPDLDKNERANIYSAMASAYESARDYDRAREMLKKALALTPKDENLESRLKALGD